MAVWKGLCRHCGREAVSRPRGLGWKCYYTPGVRALYPVSDSKQARRGVGGGSGDRPLAAAPTAARVGTLARIREYRKRAVAGEELHHPGDNRVRGSAGELRPAVLNRAVRPGELDPLAA